MKKIISFISFLSVWIISAQEAKDYSLKISGFAEVYYQYDSNNPENNSRPGFIYSHHRNNEVNINLAFIKANYETEKLRANLALATGTYMIANYSEEQGALKNIYEANIGFKISKNKNIWIDAGVFPSHIGFESAIVKDNWTLTRSIAAENSPYFETGAKISYTTDNGKWLMSGLIVNGWQRIQQVDGNSSLSFGHQLTFMPNEKLTINTSSFIGNDKPDSIRQMRYFHNLYGIYKINNKWAVRAGFDLGAEQKYKGSNSYNIWYTPVLIAKYSPTEKLSIAARGEYYDDKNGVKITTGTQNGFQMFGCSLNFDYQILSNLLWRTEVRNLNNRDAIFLNRNKKPENDSFTAVTSLSVFF
ncbi:porin [Epilithonimonas pallida]|uniref:Beta-barrel porin-2, OmpL-like. bbp2 n=1 Tax=Epilithonimonas pallida TaxID=373671 RepID=A0ABY1R7J6_9FLAO|nr:porin [Epilithonimonas pallida]SMP94206.1 Putative beta-barrel porin-2, OmpL-like. bbp2 [Epilithonimonas pallida]